MDRLPSLLYQYQSSRNLSQHQLLNSRLGTEARRKHTLDLRALNPGVSRAKTELH
jgi:hypothetical protein